MIEIKNISKSYSSNAVLEDISFQVEDGQVYGLVGKNGVGKTTLLNIIAGITEPSSGVCLIDSLEIKRGTLEQGYIGYLPDLPNFFEYLTGKEYIEFLAAASKNDAGKNAMELAAQMNLDLDKRIKALSRGNRQKLGILAAVLGSPKVLLLDEPTSALDPMGRKDTMAMIKELKASGMSIILSTHILSDLELVCDKIGFLHKGKIAREIDLASNGGEHSFYEIVIREQDCEKAHAFISQKLQMRPVVCEDNKITINEYHDGDQLTGSELLSILASAPFDIQKIEKKGRHDLEQIMEEVVRS